MFKNNELVPMTRRYPNLRKKVALRDDKIARKLVQAWDEEQDAEKLLTIYLENRHALSDYRYWELMRTVWIICGSLDVVQIFRNLMSSNRKHKYYFSTPEEAKKLREMPDIIEAYRACDTLHDEGISWTTSKEYAEWYKNQYNKKLIMTVKHLKADVFAYIDRNNENELIIL